MTQIDAIRANARGIINRGRSISNLSFKFGYNRESVEWIDSFIEQERNRPDITPADATRLIKAVGSYLGECIIHIYGGKWREENGTIGVFFDDANAVFPFNKAEKQFNNGRENGESVLSFFDLIGLVIFNKRL